MRLPPTAGKLGLVLRCLVVDDNASFIEAATTLLEREGLTVVGAASSIAEALTRVQELRPDVVLVDIMLGLESGFSLARQLGQADLGAQIILISTHAESDFAELIDQSPAVGFLSKSDLSAAAIRACARPSPPFPR